MLKNLIIDQADWFAAFSKQRARRWLAWSRWWADFAEAIQSGQSIDEIRRDREGDSHG